jgi:uncharacterized protein (DUF433 family)
MIVTLGGRWCLADSLVSVSTVARTYRSEGRDWVHENYPTVTDEMIDEALAWYFPPIHATPQLYGDDLNLICVCGEDVLRSDGFDDGELVETCPACGKKWRVTISLEPA